MQLNTGIIGPDRVPVLLVSCANYPMFQWSLSLPLWLFNRNIMHASTGIKLYTQTNEDTIPSKLSCTDCLVSSVSIPIRLLACNVIIRDLHQRILHRAGCAYHPSRFRKLAHRCRQSFLLALFLCHTYRLDPFPLRLFLMINIFNYFLINNNKISISC